MMSVLLRVAYRGGERRLYGPMSKRTAVRLRDRIRRLGEDPRSTFASATLAAVDTPASIAERIGRDGFALYGHEWQDRVAP